MITTDNLTRRYGDLTAVDELNLSVSAGAIYALLGPNGAGKTTTLSMLTTLLTPTSGSAQVAGFDVVAQAPAVRERIGVTFQEIVLDHDLTGREVLDYHGRLYALPRGERARRGADLLTLVELTDAADRLVKTYSGGMKRRLELARGLMTRPQVLFLDEPTQGLDPQNRARIWDYLRALKAEDGLSIVLTTHYMEEAEALADCVGIIDGGRMVAEGTPDELVAGLGADVIRLAGRGDAAALASRLAAERYVEQARAVDGTLQVGVDHGNRRLADVIRLARDAGYEIEDVSVSQPGLGDLFLQVTGRALRDD